MTPSRRGILAAGNFIVDYVKVIDAYPPQDTLASILSESKSNGGGPYNVLRDLAAMEVGYPLEACGLVGDDDNGRWIRSDCEACGIGTGQLHTTREKATSYTDAMTVAGTGRRTFFHQRGANALFDTSHCDFACSSARIFHLGYLMLLDKLDETDAEGRTGASRLLEAASRAGMVTSVDMVSAEHPRFREIARSALPFTDHLIINEIEASRSLGKPLASDKPQDLLAAAGELLALGVRQTVIIHTEHVAVLATISGTRGARVSLELPHGYIKGATGAGDAFAAGVLHGIHEGLPPPVWLNHGVCAAAASLSHPTPSRGLMPINHCLALIDRFRTGKTRSDESATTRL